MCRARRPGRTRRRPGLHHARRRGRAGGRGAARRGVRGLVALLAAGALAWLLSREVLKPLVQLGGAARAIADARRPAFPDSSIPEVAQHIVALRAMHRSSISASPTWCVSARRPRR